MANLTKAQFRSLVRSSLSDEASEKWADSDLDVLTQTVYDELWVLILEKNPYFVRQVDSVLPTVPGYADLRLVADGGSLTKRFHRLQEVARTDRVYREADPRDILVLGTGSGSQVIWVPSNQYTIYGDQLWLFTTNGLDDTSNIEVRYSYLPDSYTTLGETTAISWPTGAEGALMNEVCARAESEDERLREMFESRAKQSWLSLITTLHRPHFMKVGWSPNSPQEWGGI